MQYKKKSKGNVIEETSFGIQGMQLQVHTSAHTSHETLETSKKKHTLFD